MSTDSSVKILQPVNFTATDGSLIEWSGNIAHLYGMLAEIQACMSRHKQFLPLLLRREAPFDNCKVAVESDITIFVRTIDKDSPTYGFDRPCPPTVARVDKINAETGREELVDKLFDKAGTAGQRAASTTA